MASYKVVDKLSFILSFIPNLYVILVNRSDWRQFMELKMLDRTRARIYLRRHCIEPTMHIKYAAKYSIVDLKIWDSRILGVQQKNLLACEL